MKPTIKVSIGGIAFILEEDAYKQLHEYLDTLQKYFEHKEEGAEIIADVEARLSELLQMRILESQSVVSIDDIRDVIAIMGSPKDFGEESSEGEQSTQSSNPNLSHDNDFSKRRLYRDTEHSLVGGVCSGLGHYFKLDTVIIRLIFVGSLFAFNFISHRWSFFIVLLYTVLWAVVPKAKTLKDRLTMTRTDPSIENLKDRDIQFDRKRHGSGLVKVLKIFFGIILGLISFSIILMLLAMVVTMFGFYSYSNMMSVSDLLSIVNINTLDVKISLITILALPLIGVLYWCIKFLFQVKGTVKDVIISVVFSILWLGALFYLIGVGATLVKNHECKETAIHRIDFATTSDTLFVNMPDGYEDITPLLKRSNFAFYDRGERSLLITPKVIVKRDSTLSDYKVEIEKTAFGSNSKIAKSEALIPDFSFEQKDSLLIVNPRVYNANHKWDRVFFVITISTPMNKSVVIDKSLNYRYSYFD